MTADGTQGGAPHIGADAGGLSANPRRLAAMLLVIAVAASALSALFLGADSVNARHHQDYERHLRALRQADAQLNAALLASRVGLQMDFDTLVAASRDVDVAVAALSHVPDFLPDADRQRVALDIETYVVAQADKQHQVDHFKREIAVLRNSLAFLPEATDRYIADPSLTIVETRPVGTLVRGIMGYAQTGDPDLGRALLQRLNGIEAGLEGGSDRHDTLHTVLLHARAVLERKPVVDGLMYGILAMPTAVLGERISTGYALGYERASRHAHHYRAALYVFALALAGYLAMAMLRLGRTSGALAHANRDLRERVAALHRARDELKLYATVFTNACEGMVITDGSARIVAANPAFTEITGYALDDVLGRTPALLSSGRQDEAYYRGMWSTLATEGQWRGEIWNRRRDGEVFPEWLSITAVRDQAGLASHYIGIFSDITERKAAEARIHHLAHHDALTCLPNRLLLQDRLEQAILQARRKRRQAAVMFIDLDRFKLINDSLGHEVGDRLLKQVALRCVDAVRDTDTVARLGGDEFVVVLPEVADAQEAALVARKLVAALGAAYRLDSHELTVTASIGIALYPDDGATASILLRNADAAMYGSKEGGRNHYRFYSSDLDSTSLGELLLENQLRGAVDRGELRLYYQPKVAAASGQVVGAEALLRWQHPELGVLPPGRFVPAAEASGLIVPIGAWVLREACRQMRQWLDAGLAPVPVAVNLSAQQFAQQDIVQLVRDSLAEQRLPSELLELELTETMLMRDFARTDEVLAQLRAMGVRLAIDDFGSGYSSLAYLKLFDVDVLKMDRSFIGDIGSDTDDGKLAAAVIALAHSLDCQVVAEGVETAFQRDFLASHHCDQLQGYLFGRPEPAQAFAERIGARLAA